MPVSSPHGTEPIKVSLHDVGEIFGVALATALAVGLGAQTRKKKDEEAALISQ
jgi:hypothetical protein